MNHDPPGFLRLYRLRRGMAATFLPNNILPRRCLSLVARRGQCKDLSPSIPRLFLSLLYPPSCATLSQFRVRLSVPSILRERTCRAFFSPRAAAILAFTITSERTLLAISAGDSACPAKSLSAFASSSRIFPASPSWNIPPGRNIPNSSSAAGTLSASPSISKRPTTFYPWPTKLVASAFPNFGRGTTAP